MTKRASLGFQKVARLRLHDRDKAANMKLAIELRCFRWRQIPCPRSLG
jgi:hypothetical protein